MRFTKIFCNDIDQGEGVPLTIMLPVRYGLTVLPLLVCSGESGGGTSLVVALLVGGEWVSPRKGPRLGVLPIIGAPRPPSSRRVLKENMCSSN